MYTQFGYGNFSASQIAAVEELDRAFAKVRKAGLVVLDMGPFLSIYNRHQWNRMGGDVSLLSTSLCLNAKMAEYLKQAPA